MAKTRDFFQEIKKHIIDNPGTSSADIYEEFGQSMEVSKTIGSLLSGNWIDPDGKGGYIYRPESEDDAILEDNSGVDYTWERSYLSLDHNFFNLFNT